MNLKLFNNLMWAAIAVLLEPPFDALDQELETDLSNLAESFVHLSFSLDNCSRCQSYNLDASAFIAHVSPKLTRGLKSDDSIYTAAFLCLISTRNGDTSAFVRMWIKEYGLEHPLTQYLVNVVPLISRLISLTRAFAYIKHIEKIARPDRSYIAPSPGEIDYEIRKREDSQIEEAWLSLQN
ncbi:MAG: hypothetical protein HC878_20430 [Leptolyngbyaceae cyanobacterium SL_5_14]|nr:hypothetical protein [Leptolyngbyaceae cyanobacterium SL_5_14]